jgi:hypothetical protein
MGSSPDKEVVGVFLCAFFVAPLQQRFYDIKAK